MKAVINPLYPNRVQVQLSDPSGPAVGPLATTDFVGFDPRRDLELYFDGLDVEVISFTYDAIYDQYLIFTDLETPISGLAQVIYHMPLDPFAGSQGVIPGFAIIASVALVYDPVFSLLAISVPVSSNPGWVYFQPPPASSAPYGWNDGGYGDGEFGGSDGTSTNTNIAVTGFGHGGFGSGGYGGKTATSATAAVTKTGFGNAGFGAGGYGGNTAPPDGSTYVGFGSAGFGSGGYGGHTAAPITNSTIVTGFGAEGFGHGGYGGHTNPATNPQLSGGYGVGPYGGGIILTIATPNGEIPVYYIPDLAAPGSSTLPPLVIDFYALGIAQVRIQSNDGSFDSGYIDAKALYGTISVPNLTPGEQLQLAITGYDSVGNIVSQNGTQMILVFALVVATS